MINLPSHFNRILITGGSGFIGGTLIRRLIRNTEVKLFNLDKLGYASNLEIHNRYKHLDRYKLLKVNLSNYEETKAAVKLANPDIVFHLAAESHVDKSITGPTTFLESNVIGTFNLLQAIRPHWESLSITRKDKFKIIHVSTDEVFGSLGHDGFFSEESSYNPSSPYSATKAASDHLVKAWYRTYGLPSIITNSSNNFGPWQLPEKLIPVIVLNAMSNNPIPIYGDGKNVRDWIYVEDHIDALIKVALNGKVGESYCVGGGEEKSNEEIVELICYLLDCQNKSNAPHNRLKVYIKDRLGHDRRYAIDNNKIRKELNWYPKYNFDEAILTTVEWYIENINWCTKYKNQ
tara:strand:- start:98 stop:1138 length:1041 start_codon:yes stop_codon:yes gene_type:complete